MNNLIRFVSNLGIVLKKIRLFPRLIKNYILLAFGKTALRTVEIALTYECQCRCKHCSSYGLKDKKKEELSINKIKKLIDDAVKEGAIHILFTGGETLLAKNKLILLLKYAKRKACLTSIDTNGLLLDKKYALELKKAGLDVACVSLDSFNEKKHDKFRGYVGCWKKSIGAIKIFRRLRINVIISTLITKNNLRNGDLKKILKFAKDNGSSVIFCLPVMTGRWKDNKKDKLDKKDFKKVEEIMKHPLARLCEENNYFFKGCAAGSEKITVSLYGDVTPCSFIKEKYGNIRKDKLTSILKRMRKNKYYNKVNRKIKCLASER